MISHPGSPSPQNEKEQTPKKMENADSNRTVYVGLNSYQLQYTRLCSLKQLLIILIDIHRVTPQAANSTSKPLPKPSMKPKVYLPFISIQKK